LEQAKAVDDHCVEYDHSQGFAENSHGERLRVIIDPYPFGRALMIRDMELIRKILAQVKSKNDLHPDPLAIDRFDDLLVARHVEMMHREGFLEGIPVRLTTLPYDQILVKDLTWSGHDLLGALENQEVWSTLKKAFSPQELGRIPLSVVRDAGVALLKQYVMRKLGLPGS
jgi:hypothetical protein